MYSVDQSLIRFIQPTNSTIRGQSTFQYIIDSSIRSFIKKKIGFGGGVISGFLLYDSHPICTDAWSLNNARVVCRQLHSGMTDVEVLDHAPSTETADLSRSFAQIDYFCRGNERSIPFFTTDSVAIGVCKGFTDRLTLSHLNKKFENTVQQSFFYTNPSDLALFF